MVWIPKSPNSRICDICQSVIQNLGLISGKTKSNPQSKYITQILISSNGPRLGGGGAAAGA